jgi:tRNA nucleotidyltransferase/poly(A) polymerase
MNEKPSYYAVIPAKVRYDSILTPNAKLLYAEITALCNMNGKCIASTQYFANLYNVSRVSIQKWLKQLEDNKHIKRKVIYKEGTKQILHRYITLVSKPSSHLVGQASKDKLTDNTNISISNTNLTDSNRRIINKLKKEVEAFDTIDKHKEDFLEYWLESNQKGKTKYEMQKTWSTKRRLKNWILNYNNWWEKNNPSNHSKVDNQLNEYLKGKEYL